MLGKALWFAVISSVLLLPTGSGRSFDQFGRIVYKIPAGWAAKTVGTEMRLEPQDLDSGQVCQITLYPSSRRASPFKTFVTNRWKEFKTAYTVKTENDLISQKDDDGHDAIVATASLEKDGKDYLAIYLASDLPKSVETFSFVCSAALFDKYRDVAEAFFKEATFTDKPTPPTPPPTKPGTEPGLGLPAPAPMPSGTPAAAAEALAKKAAHGDLASLLRAMLASGLTIKDGDNKAVYRPEKGEATGFAINALALQSAMRSLRSAPSIPESALQSLIRGPASLKVSLTVADLKAEIATCAKSPHRGHRFWGQFMTSLMAQNPPGSVDPVSVGLILHKMACDSIFAQKLKKPLVSKLMAALPNSSGWLPLQSPFQSELDDFVDGILHPEMAGGPDAQLMLDMYTEAWDKILEAQKSDPELKNRHFEEYVVLCYLAQHLRDMVRLEVEKDEEPLVRTKVKGQEGAKKDGKFFLVLQASPEEAQLFNRAASHLALQSRITEGKTRLGGTVEFFPSSTRGMRQKEVEVETKRVEVSDSAGGTIVLKGATQTRNLTAAPKKDDFDWFFEHFKDPKLPPTVRETEFGAVTQIVKSAFDPPTRQLTQKGAITGQTHRILVRDWKVSDHWTGVVEIVVSGSSVKPKTGNIFRKIRSDVELTDGFAAYSINRVLTYDDMQQKGRFYSWRNNTYEGTATVSDNADFDIEEGCLEKDKSKHHVSIHSTADPAEVKDVRVIIQRDDVQKKAWVKVEGGTSAWGKYTKTTSPPRKNEASTVTYRQSNDLFKGTPWAGDRALFEVDYNAVQMGNIEITKTTTAKLAWEIFTIDCKFNLHIYLDSGGPPGRPIVSRGFFDLHSESLRLKALDASKGSWLQELLSTQAPSPEEDIATCYATSVPAERTTLKHSTSTRAPSAPKR